MSDELKDALEPDKLVHSTKPKKEQSLTSIQDVENILRIGKTVDTASLLKNCDVLMYGEDHRDYAIADHLLEQVQVFKNSGVTSFGFEINTSPRIQKIFDEINSGNFEQASAIDWSFAIGNPTVRETKQRLVVELVKAGIKVYPFADWQNDSDIIGEYSKENEEKAAKIINEKNNDGKTVVLIGGRHAEYKDKRREIKFPHTADCLNKLGKKIKSIALAGGMVNPDTFSSKDPESLIKRAVSRNKIRSPIFIDTKNTKIEGFHNDGILILPAVPFLAGNAPIPNERMPIGRFTPLANVRSREAIDGARVTIKNAIQKK